MTPQQQLEAFDRTGGISSQDGKTESVFCWAGVHKGRVWIHRGGQPTWGPPVDAVQAVGGDIIQRRPDGSIRYYLTGPGEGGTITHGQALQAIDKQREIMSREEALSYLGDPPAWKMDVE